MRTLTCYYSEPHFLSKNPSFHRTNKKPIILLHKRCILYTKNTTFSSFRASCTANSAAPCNGWDDLRVFIDSDQLGESNYIKKILISLGINDKKYVFTCILGFVCALAVSRVRVSSILVFPAAAVVFAVGFSFGFVNGRPNSGLGLNGAKRMVKDESLRVFVEKLKGVVEMFDGFDVKVGELKKGVKRAVNCERVELSELESYVSALESIDGLVLSTRSLVEDCIGGVSAELEVEKSGNKRKSSKKRENENSGFRFFEFVGGFFGDDAKGSKTSRTNVSRIDNVVKGVDSPGREDLRGSAVEREADSASTLNAGNILTSSDGSGDRIQERERRMRSGERGTTDAYMNTQTFRDGSRFDNRNTRFMDNQRFSFSMSAHREVRKWTSDDSLSGYAEFDITKEHEENEASFKNQRVLWDSDRAYESYRERENGDYGSYRASFRRERMDIEDELHTRKYQSQPEDTVDPFSSSRVSDDMLFDKCLMKANDLLKQAKECLKVRNDEVLAEDMLHESAKLLTQAIAMKPMSLLAIGQLGNTYLLHGELKLRTSRELRSLLSRDDDFGVEIRSNYFSSVDEMLPSKDKIATRLVSACEECEGLLVEAGRKYRTAMSIDGNDVRALYNWGLALFFRAQLISDIGPEAAVDADKLFLAAIDKFDAMMSRSNVYAPEALFRWGVALQQRSRLRPSNSRDKVKLLQQAKRLYKDALDMGSNNLQVRDALSSCMSELDVGDI